MINFHRLFILLMVLAAGTAEAVQLGQLTVASQRGEPLAARIELYGATVESATEYRFELRPDIGANNSATIADFVAITAHDTGGNPYISLQSGSAVTASPITFRLRMTGPAGSVVRHYSFALNTPPVVTAPVAARRAARPVQQVSPTVPRSMVQTQSAPPTTIGVYGPVRPGQSLWRILQANGLAGGNIAATMARIVTANPQAFVGGDANRLVAGAMLELGLSNSVSPVVTRSATVAATAAVPVASTPSKNTATAARLAALELKFAAIRARYAAQPTAKPAVIAEAVTVAVPAASTANIEVPEASPMTSGVLPPVVSKPQRPTVPPAEVVQESSMLVMLPALPAIGALLGLLMLGITLRAARRKRTLRHVADHQDQDQDQERMAQITAKAEKRLQLEDEVKRSFNNNRLQLAKKPTPAVERTVEPHAAMSHGFEEIETRIAYGHYDQAASLLADVLDKSPRNHRAKLRLAEVYYLSGEREAFVALAVEIQSEHRAEIDDDEWGRIVRMGKIIAPESAPFRGPTVIESLQLVG